MAQTALRRGTQEDGNSEYFTGCPIGGGFIWYELPNKIPVNCRICDNSTLAISQFAKLNENIGGSWGTDGTNVNLPDLRGRFPRGVDAGAGNDPDRLARTGPNPGQNVADAVGSVQEDAMQNITGQFGFTDNDATSQRVRVGEATGAFGGVSGSGSASLSGGGYSGDIAVDFDASRQVRTSTEHRPKNANVYFVIRVS